MTVVAVASIFLAPALDACADGDQDLLTCLRSQAGGLAIEGTEQVLGRDEAEPAGAPAPEIAGEPPAGPVDAPAAPSMPPVTEASEPDTAEAETATEPALPSETIAPRTDAADAGSPPGAPEVAHAAPNADALVADTGTSAGPRVDMLSVTPDGAVVIAGRSEPGEDVSVFANGELFGTAKAEPNGDWAMLAETPLPAGGTAITVGDAGGEVVAETAFVVVIDPEREAAPRVIESVPEETASVLLEVAPPLVEVPAVPDTGAVTANTADTEAPPARPEAVPPMPAPEMPMAAPERITEAPALAAAEETPGQTIAPNEAPEPVPPAKPPEVVAAPPPNPVSTAAARPPAISQDTPPPAAATEPPPAPAAVAPTDLEVAQVPETVAPGGPVPAEPPMAVGPPAGDAGEELTIDAVEIDGDAIFVAGDGAEGARVTVYAGDQPVGEARVEDGRWLVEGRGEWRLSQRLRAAVRGEGGSDDTVEVEVVFDAEPEAASADAAGLVPVGERAAREVAAALAAPVDVPVAVTAVESETGAPAAVTGATVKLDAAALARGREEAQRAIILAERPVKPPSAELPGASDVVTPPAGGTPPAAPPVVADETPAPTALDPSARARAEVAVALAGAGSVADPEPAIAAAAADVTTVTATIGVRPAAERAVDEVALALAALPQPVAEPVLEQQASIEEPPNAVSPPPAFAPPVAGASAPLDVPPPVEVAVVPVAPEAASIQPVEPVVEPSPAAATPRAEVPTIRAVAIDKAELARTRPGRIIVRRGDTLWDIADRVYGSGTKYQTIYRANRHVIPRPGKLLPGQVLEIPLVYD